MKRHFTIFIYLYSFGLMGQKIVYSPFDETDKKKAEEVAEEFMQKIQGKQFTSLNKIFPNDEANINGDFFMPMDSYIQMLSDSFKESELAEWSIEALTFDEILASEELRAKALKVYRVFNNFRILCLVRYSDRGKDHEGVIVLRKEGEEWKIYSITDFGLRSVIMNTDALSGKDHRMEDLSEIGVSIPIPIKFSPKQASTNQYFFNLNENDLTMAQFHIMYGPLQTDIELVTFRFIEYVYKERGSYSDLTIYLYPTGVLFDYWVTDHQGGQNKGYTMGIAHKDKAIFVQYNSTKEVYQDYWKELDYTFRNIVLKP